MLSLDYPAELKDAIEQLHGGLATHVRSEQVTEAWKGRIIWDGVVHVFDLAGNDLATVAYAWTAPIGNSAQRRIFAVLKTPPIDSLSDAVRASMATERAAENPAKS